MDDGQQRASRSLSGEAEPAVGCDAAGVVYTRLRHAYVGEAETHRDQLLPVEWVMLSRWDHDSGATEFCVEYLDCQTEIAAEDDSFDSLAEAERSAVEQFNLTADDWRDGTPAPA